MTDEFSEIESGLRDRRISAYRQRPGQLVLSRQRGPVWPDAGNSFWICKLAGDWYVCTWSPRYYRVPPASPVLDVAEAFVDVGNTAQFSVPDELVNRFGLVETEYEAFQRLWVDCNGPWDEPE
jgi:hypothetical protein